MRIVKLALENWRGVESLEIEFSEGITLIEGPNEIGKSTLVEALHMLFDELDSSNKKAVNEIQPVGQDVSSRVEAEIITGDFHFVYAKSYNKNKQTSLRILAPRAEQLTGREAHERAEQIMQTTIDMGLWNALLVEQGLEITGVHLADSDGLARALDQAAGSSSLEVGDSDLYAIVQSEYEQYFTLKTGKSKFAGEEKKLLEVQAAVGQERDALSSTEKDSAEYERCAAEIRRLDDTLPDLLESMSKHEANWKIISSLQQQMTNKQVELDTAEQLWQATVDDQDRRIKLTEDLAKSGQALAEKKEQVEPLAESIPGLKATSDTADDALKDLKEAQKNARACVELTRADEQYLKEIEQLREEKQRLGSIKDFNSKAANVRTKLADIRIDPTRLEALRSAEIQLQIAIGKRDAATSAVEIVAQQDLGFSLNGEQVDLSAGTKETRQVASELHIDIPGVASIGVIPSQSAAELEADVVDYETALKALLVKYSVKNLADAVATEAQRADYETDLNNWSNKINELLGDDSEADIQAMVDQLQPDSNDYLAGRPDEPAIAEGPGLATIMAKDAEDELAKCGTAVDSQLLECEELREAYRQAEADARVETQVITGLELDVKNRQKQLDDARSSTPDETLDDRVSKRADCVGVFKKELEGLAAEFELASPEASEELLNNARATHQRAEINLQESKTDLAVLEDRLTKAQANGRFEALEAARREVDELTSQHESLTTRAAAAQRLWATINKHRDNTRRAYVQPLKEGIEQLGKIVFGADFAVDLDEDWALVSCTRDGKTIPFESLSVGAREQLGILTRLAAARLVSSQGGVPLIIDDALGYSDPGRLESMGAAIAATGRDSQIILLTCTPDRFTRVGSAKVVRL